MSYVQTPSTMWVPERRGTYGDIAVDLGNKIGLHPDPTQVRDIDILASYGPGGRWLTLETCIVEGRQNGKTKRVALLIALMDFFIFGKTDPDRIIWTSHLMSTTKDTFNLLIQLIDENPILSARVKNWTDNAEERSIELIDGSRWDCMARTGGAGRGLGGKRVVYDEAMFLKMEQIGASMPTLSARDNPQVSYASSAEKRDGTHLRALRARAQRGGDPGLAFIEYAAPGGWDNPGCLHGLQCSHLFGEEGCTLDREDYWRMANHAVGQGRMRIEFIRNERRTLGETAEGVLEFGRERMGWPELGGKVLDPDRVPENAWEYTRDETSQIVGPVVFSVDMPPDASAVSIGVAGRRADGAIHFGVIDYRRGTAWVPSRLKELTEKHETMCAPLWTPEGPIGALATRFEDEGLELEPLSPRAMAQGCGSFKEHIIAATAWHRSSTVLDTAFKSAERRVNAEGAWVWGRVRSGGDIAPLYAVTEAVLGVELYGDHEPSVWVV